MIWIGQIESSKSVAELKTSNTVTGAQSQTHLAVLDYKKNEWPQEEQKKEAEKLDFEAWLDFRNHRESGDKLSP